MWLFGVEDGACGRLLTESAHNVNNASCSERLNTQHPPLPQLTFLTLRDPGPVFRAMVILAQGVFFNAYFVAYLLSPKTSHAMVGYLEEVGPPAVSCLVHVCFEGGVRGEKLV